jgi:hypothetical protein
MVKDGDKPGEPSDADKAAAKSSPSAPERALALPHSGRDASGVSSTQWPVLTRSNYTTWSLLMRVILQARHLWDVIESGVGD